MAKKTKTYPLYIALLLCFFQVAGIDVYAQEPVKVSQDSISPVREAPKARARRHREPVVSTPATDSVKVEKAVVLPPIDSLENLKPAIVTADTAGNNRYIGLSISYSLLCRLGLLFGYIYSCKNIIIRFHL